MEIKNIISAYEKTPSIRQIAIEFGLSHTKVRKILITYGVLEYKQTEKALKALKEGKTIKEIAKEWGCTENTVHNYLPYTKGVYGDEQASPNALKIRRWRKNRK